MSFHLQRNEVAINYKSYLREYSIDYRQKTSVQQIEFCPWCGMKLPEILLEQWQNELDDLQLFDPFGDDRTKVPAEFWTEEWWIKRGL
jgi:hypothetical protein